MTDAGIDFLSKTALSRSVQVLDEKIVNTCNDLMRMKAYTPKMAVDNTNERARLKRECEQREGLVASRLRGGRHSKDLSMYRSVCDQVFEEMGIAVPAIVSSRQSQLLLHVHMMTVLDNQTDLLRKHRRREFLRLQEELNTLQQEQCMNESRILRDILNLESQIKELEEKLAGCPLRTEELKGSRLLPPKREVSSSSNRTMDTISSDGSASEDDDVCSGEFVPPMVQSPRFSAPSRPQGLVALSPSGNTALVTTMF